MTDETQHPTDQVDDRSDELASALAAHADELARARSDIQQLHEAIGHLRDDIAEMQRKLPDH
ncbi:hypothetical protein [Glycomyces xiaoerkulensis]|uniref:hypothetical protein n=1 Tax=Glycomyces xiaoerkulensis TaxID=2038139 RepID=UPI0012FFF306|nr:hypothetical protein [Glycomyces xiaoerkulensis]